LPSFLAASTSLSHSEFLVCENASGTKHPAPIIHKKTALNTASERLIVDPF